MEKSPYGIHWVRVATQSKAANTSSEPFVNNSSYVFGLLDRSKKVKLLLLLALSVFVSFLELMSIGAILPFIDLLINGADAKSLSLFPFEIDLFFISILLGTVTLISAVAKILLLFSQNLVAHGIGSVIASIMVNKAFFIGYASITEKHQTNLTTSIWQRTNEVVYQSVLPSLVLISSLIVLVVNFSFFILIEPVVTLALGAILFFVYFGVYEIVKMRLSIHGKTISDVNATLLGMLQELFGRYRNIVLKGQENRFVEEYIGFDKSVRGARARVQIIGGFPKIAVETAFIILISIIGLISVKGLMEVGDYLPFFASLAFGLQKMLPHVQQIYQSKVALQSGSPALEEIRSFISQENLRDTNLTKPDDKNVLWSFDKVSYCYPNGESKPLNSISFEIRRGDTVCISGPSGSGKSTLVDLLLHFRMPTSGRLQSDVFKNTEINSTLITQNYQLVNGSIRDNLTRYCGENVTDEQLWRALDTVFLSDFVKTLPEELDSPIINDASNFSGGQRQRLNLAVALVENFDILILDEPTSNLNEDLEADIFRRILDTYNNRTIIYITHSEQIKLKSEKVIYIQ